MLDVLLFLGSGTGYSVHPTRSLLAEPELITQQAVWFQWGSQNGADCSLGRDIL
jgi:hypothetical protein